ncbi:hypothetical protein M378DRAFT_39305, partial [Amanita muscaria Koide BX008]
PAFAASGDSAIFFHEILKTDVYSVLRKFEMWACTRDHVPKTDTLVSMRSECANLITESLQTITQNKKVTMNYANYDRAIVQKFHVKLVGWPEDIKFATPHTIYTVDEARLLRHYLQEKSCHWVKLSKQEARKHMASIVEKEKEGVIIGRKRKVRSDKG